MNKYTRTYKIKSGSGDPKTGICTVEIQTPEGIFTGTSRCCPEDMKYYNEYVGCCFAEGKAVQKWYLFLKRRAQERLYAVKALAHDIEVNRKYTYMDLAIIRRIKLAIRNYEDEVKHWTIMYNKTGRKIKRAIQDRDYYVRHHLKGKEGKNK